MKGIEKANPINRDVLRTMLGIYYRVLHKPLINAQLLNKDINLLSANTQKWSNSLKNFVVKYGD